MTVTAQRITYLRDWLRQKLEDQSPGDLFLEDGTDRIIWVSSEDEVEVLVITLQAGRIEVAS